MKKIFNFILGMVMCFSLTSCVTAAQAQVTEVVDDANVSVVITYGTPYYDANGLLLYYMYRNMYYYPYYYNSKWCFRYYSRPLPPRHYKPIHRYFYHHKPHVEHHKPHMGHHRPSTNGNRGFGTHSRPNTNNGNRPNRGGHFGGGRR